MKLTKYQHACVVLEDRGQKLVIDPGWTDTFGDSSSIVAVVITHKHVDHCNPDHVAAIAAANPAVQIFGTQQVAEALPDHDVTIAQPGQSVQVGPFTLAFYGGQHATILPSMPADQNIGVLVNNAFYYAGDSFVAPGVPVQLLALPVSAPWLKFSEAADFLTTVHPTTCFATHNAILSEVGQKVMDHWVSGVCQEIDTMYTPLKPGEPTEV